MAHLFVCVSLQLCIFTILMTAVGPSAARAKGDPLWGIEVYGAASAAAGVGNHPVQIFSTNGFVQPDRLYEFRERARRGDLLRSQQRGPGALYCGCLRTGFREPEGNERQRDRGCLGLVGPQHRCFRRPGRVGYQPLVRHALFCRPFARHSRGLSGDFYVCSLPGSNNFPGRRPTTTFPLRS